MTELIRARQRPCSSCPYRRDVPSGIWDDVEYGKLCGYDGDIPEQLEAEALRLFYCHSLPRNLCAGWVGCHDMDNTLAVRLNHARIHPSVYTYVSSVPLFTSGAQAALHGMRDIADPTPDAENAIRNLRRILIARKRKEDK
jgi:hypothetical protein